MNDFEKPCGRALLVVSLLGLILILSFAEAAAQGSGFPLPKETDTRFVIDTDLDTYCYYRNDGPLEFTIYIDRYVAPVGPYGYLDRWQDLVEDGVISAVAQLYMPMFDVDYDCPPNPECFCERDKVYFNNKFVGYCTGSNMQWEMVNLSIPIRYVRFPQVGGQPAPNQIRIEIDVANAGVPAGGRLCWCTAVDWAALSFQAARPIILVHGFTSNSNTWDDIWAQELALMRYTFWPIDVGEVSSIRENGRLINPIITSMTEQYGVDKVNIVGHSKGGLDSRYGIELNHDVDKLVMIGTPNEGSPWAEIAQLLTPVIPWYPYYYIDMARIIILLRYPGLRDLLPYRMRQFNGDHDRIQDVTYIAMAGIWEFWPGMGFHFLEGPDDLVVQQSSVEVLGYDSEDPFYSTGWQHLEAIHTFQIGSNYYLFRRVRDLYLSVFRQNEPYLFNQGADDVGGPPLIASDTTSTGLQLLPLAVDSIESNATKSTEIYVDQAPGICFNLLWGAGHLDLALLNPLGERIDSTVAASGDTIMFFREESTPGFHLISYGLSNNPMSGIWTLEVTSDALETEPVIYAIATSLQEPLVTLEVSTDKAFYQNSESVVITANLRKDDEPIKDASVLAVLAVENTVIDTMLLFDDGTHGDPIADDGQYVNTFSNTTQGGRYDVVFDARKESPEVFNRVCAIDFTVSRSSSQISGDIDEAAIDTDDDKLFDLLRMNVALDITAAGDYLLTGQLLDDQERQIGSAAIETTLTAGTCFLPLDFDGESIYESRSDGPYFLSHLALIEVDTSEFLTVASTENAHVTESYSRWDFQGPGVFVGGVASDQGLDSDNDGLYDTLEVCIDIEVSVDDYYEWAVNIADSLGNVISWGFGADSLSAGPQFICTKVTGSKIGASGIDGPYAVAGVLVRGSDPRNSTTTEVVGLSAGYLSSEFEGSSVPFYGGSISELVLLDHDVILNEDLIIEARGELFVDAGVTIYVLPDSNITISNHGLLVTDGTPTNPVVIQPWIQAPNTPDPGDWYGVDCDAGSFTALNSCNLRFAYSGISAVSPAYLSIDNCTIEDCQEAGVFVYESYAGLEVVNTRIENCGEYGIFNKMGSLSSTGNTISDCQYGIFYHGDAQCQIEDCQIAGGQTGTYYGVYLLGESNQEPRLVIKRTSITGFDQGGVYVAGASKESQLTDLNVTASGVYGIFLDANGFTPPINVESWEANFMVENEIGLWVSADNSAYVRRTKFSRNMTGSTYIAKGGWADLGTESEPGMNSFYASENHKYYITNENAQYIDAIYNFWEPLDETIIYNANYEPYLTDDPLPSPRREAPQERPPVGNFELAEAFPNPFNATTTIRFSLADPADVSVEIFNLLGQRVRGLFRGPALAGTNSLIWDGANDSGQKVATGVYLVQLRSDVASRTVKVTILK